MIEQSAGIRVHLEDRANDEISKAMIQKSTDVLLLKLLTGKIITFVEIPRGTMLVAKKWTNLKWSDS